MSAGPVSTRCGSASGSGLGLVHWAPGQRTRRTPWVCPGGERDARVLDRAAVDVGEFNNAQRTDVGGERTWNRLGMGAAVIVLRRRQRQLQRRQSGARRSLGFHSVLCVLCGAFWVGSRAESVRDERSSSLTMNMVLLLLHGGQNFGKRKERRGAYRRAAFILRRPSGDSMSLWAPCGDLPIKTVFPLWRLTSVGLTTRRGVLFAWRGSGGLAKVFCHGQTDRGDDRRAASACSLRAFDRRRLHESRAHGRGLGARGIATSSPRRCGDAFEAVETVPRSSLARPLGLRCDQTAGE